MNTDPPLLVALKSLAQRRARPGKLPTPALRMLGRPFLHD